MSVRSTMNPRYLGIGAMVASAALGVSFAGTGPAYAAPKTPSTPAASVANHTLFITGTNGPDEIALAGSNDDPNALDVELGSGNRQRFDRSTFNAISVSLGNGDDQFTEAPGDFADEALTVDGGHGDDHIVTGDGNDVIFGGSGDDTILSGTGDDLIFGDSGNDLADGQLGHDTAFLGSGHDSFQWDPGDGSDVIDGGGSTDTLVFNGAPVSENMSLSANGNRSVFLRDRGNIRMDMNDVEQLNLKTLGGADAVTIDDMHGTGFRDVNVDLATAVVGDNSANVVTVNGTDHADHARVDSHGSQVDVSGLTPETHITGSESIDQLRINTLDGNDTVDVDNGVATLIGVQTDLGSGQH